MNLVKLKQGKKFKGCSLKFVSRINNDGKTMIPMEQEPSYLQGNTFTVFCLSITHKKWIATNGSATYIVELIDDETGKKCPIPWGEKNQH